MFMRHITITRGPPMRAEIYVAFDFNTIIKTSPKMAEGTPETEEQLKAKVLYGFEWICPKHAEKIQGAHNGAAPDSYFLFNNNERSLSSAANFTYRGNIGAESVSTGGAY